MFEVQFANNGIPHTVYAVKQFFKKTWFLFYINNKWVWKESKYYKPI